MKKTVTSSLYANWLNTMEWQFFCTFSTRYDMSVKSARRAMERLQNFITVNYGKARIFWVAEPFDTKYGYHTHALLYIEKPIGKSLKTLIHKAWQVVSKGKGGKENNHTTLKQYNKELGANYYVSKYMLRKNADYDFLI